MLRTITTPPTPRRLLEPPTTSPAHSVPSGGVTYPPQDTLPAWLPQAAGESHGWRMQNHRKQYLGNCSSKVFRCLPNNLQNPFYCCFRFLKFETPQCAVIKPSDMPAVKTRVVHDSTRSCNHPGWAGRTLRTAANLPDLHSLPGWKQNWTLRSPFEGSGEVSCLFEVGQGLSSVGEPDKWLPNTAMHQNPPRERSRSRSTPPHFPTPPPH